MRCSCEAVSRSKHGTIGNEETLGRLVFSPQHISAKGKIKPGLFNLTDIKIRGLSLVRTGKINPTDLAFFASAVAGMLPGRSLLGHAEFLASVARELVDDGGKRTTCVFDDPTAKDGSIPANPAHALLISAIDGIDDEDAMEIRAHLLQNYTFVPC